MRLATGRGQTHRGPAAPGKIYVPDVIRVLRTRTELFVTRPGTLYQKSQIPIYKSRTGPHLSIFDATHMGQCSTQAQGTKRERRGLCAIVSVPWGVRHKTTEKSLGARRRPFHPLSILQDPPGFPKICSVFATWGLGTSALMIINPEPCPPAARYTLASASPFPQSHLHRVETTSLVS